MSKIKNNQSGFIVLLFTLIIMTVTVGIVLSISSLTLGQQKISYNVVKSAQAYYTAESGVEDIILRLSKGVQWTTPYTLAVEGGSTNIDVSDAIGGSRTIISNGSVKDRFRKINIVYEVASSQIPFFYGAQAGDGGVEMGNNSRIKGNVFSNGSVVSTSGKGYIDNSVIVAKNGNRIEGLDVGQDALVYSCVKSTIHRDLTYVPPGTKSNCSVTGSTNTRDQEVDSLDLPISLAQVSEWKDEASVNKSLDDYVLTDGATASLGPVQIGDINNPKNLTITNNAHLKITGTIYVTGNVEFSNNAIVELDKNSYGSFIGFIIADGRVTVGNNVILRGSGETGSYLLLLSTNSSLNPSSPAISVGNNAEGVIFYTTSGLIYLSNNMKAREITGYKIKIDNNAEVQYESGLQNAIFSNGPGGSWRVGSWKEVE